MKTRESPYFKLRVDFTFMEHKKMEGDGGLIQQENDKLLFGGWDIKEVVQFETC